jgi:hypothetical protein
MELFFVAAVLVRSPLTLGASLGSMSTAIRGKKKSLKYHGE